MTEFVRLLPDWGLAPELYIDVDTSMNPMDSWSHRLATSGITPFATYDNGIHTLRAEWYDQGGNVLYDKACVAFEVSLIDPTNSDGGGPGVRDPGDQYLIGDDDEDEDGVPDRFDNCATKDNGDQADTDFDGLGDECDRDRDGDGTLNLLDTCPTVANHEQRDNDADGEGDACDDDDDNDGVADYGNGGVKLDNCPLFPNPTQADLNRDGVGDICQGDRDNDGIVDQLDAFPDDAEAWSDADLDGRPDQGAAAARSSGAKRTGTEVTVPELGAQIGPAGVGFVMSAILLLVAVGVVASRRT
jgi:hypothetical protein